MVLRIWMYGAGVRGILLDLRLTKMMNRYSMGGMVPTHLAATHPDKVVSAICIGPVHPTESVAQVFRDRIKTVIEGEFCQAQLNTSHLRYPGKRSC